MILDELRAAACAHIDLNWDTFKGISIDGLIVEVILQTFFVPLVSLDARLCDFTNESCVGIPGGFKDTATSCRRAAVAALITFGVVQVPISILDVLAARLRFQMVSQTTISIIDTVGAINAVH